MTKLQPGDRIAYAAKFLKSTGQLTGGAPMRRGTFIAMQDEAYARVHWDDTPQRIADKQGDFAEADYRDEISRNGSMVHAGNIAKVGSARFALNDL